MNKKFQQLWTIITYFFIFSNKNKYLLIFFVYLPSTGNTDKTKNKN